MHLLELPQEILLLIFSKLEFGSLLNIFHSCSYLRKLVCTSGLCKSCKLHLSLLGTAQTLKLDYFKIISPNIEELNLSGLPDINKTLLLTASKQLKSIKTLNVSYTNISISDLIGIFKVCPTIKNVSINFMFNTKKCKLTSRLLSESQQMFKNFINVELVGSLSNLIYSTLPFYILEKASCSKVKMTVIQCNHIAYHNEDFESIFKFDKLSIFLIDWKYENYYHGSLSEGVIFSYLNVSKIEFFIIKRLNMFCGLKVYVSPGFKDFFKINFNIEEEHIINFSDQPLSSNIVMMMYSKESTSFDKLFFSQLASKLKVLFPIADNEVRPSHCYSDWKYMLLDDESLIKIESSTSKKSYEPAAKKKRKGLVAHSFQCETITKHTNITKLSLLFRSYSKPVRFSSCDTLRYLKYIGLRGNVIFDVDFFSIVFTQCKSLETLNVEVTFLMPNQCLYMITRTIRLAKSLKNFRFVNKRVDFKSLISSLSLCKSIENIHIVDTAHYVQNWLEDLPILVKRCPKIYSLFVVSSMSDIALKKTLTAINKQKAFSKKPYLNVEVYDISSHDFGYNPYMDVFSINPLKPID